jgi:hypothetical protein
MWGALFDERTDLSFVRVAVSSNKSVVSMYCIYRGSLSVQAQYSRSCHIICSSCYNSSQFELVNVIVFKKTALRGPHRKHRSSIVALVLVFAGT